MNEYGIISSKQYYDAKDCSLENLSFTSSANLFKTKLEGNYSILIPANETNASITIYHNLGYEPAVLVFGDKLPNDQTTRNRLPFNLGGLIRHYCDIYTDRIVISVMHSDGPYMPPPAYNRTFTGHYYIFLDPLFV